MIFTFNRALNFDKIVIFRSFQQSKNELYNISHFKNEYVPFFDRVLIGQLKDAASAVASREKCTSLVEMFSIELKFTIDTLKIGSVNSKNQNVLSWIMKKKKKNIGKNIILLQIALNVASVILILIPIATMVGLIT